MTLLVAGPEVEEQCHQLGMPLAAPLAEGWALPAKPRCLNIEKGPQGFGFLLREEKGLDGRLGEWQLWSWVGWSYTSIVIASQCPWEVPHSPQRHPPSSYGVSSWESMGVSLGRAVKMSMSQGSSCGRWIRDCQLTRLG